MINNIKLKYLSLSKPVKFSIYLTLVTLFQKSILFLMTPILTRILTPSEYGEYMLFQTWYQIFFIFATLNLSYGSFNKGLSEFEDNKNGYSSSIQSLSTILTFLFLLILCIFSDFFVRATNLPFYLLLFMILNFLFLPSFEFWKIIEREKYNYNSITKVMLFIAIFTPIFSFLSVFLFSNKIVGYIIGSYLCVLLVSIYFYFYIYKVGKKTYDKMYWKFALLFNLPLIFHYLANIILSSSDRIMIEMILGIEETGIYSLIYTLGMVLLVITNSINSSITPMMYNVLKNNDVNSINGIKKTNEKIIFVILLLISFVMLMAPEILMLMAPSEYSSGVHLIPPIVGSVLYIYIYSFVVNVEFYNKKTFNISVSSVLSAIINIALNMMFIPLFGLLAAAYTTLFCYVMYSMFHVYNANKLLQNQYRINLFDFNRFFWYSLYIAILISMSYIFYNYTTYKYIFLFIIFLTIYLNRKKYLTKKVW